MPITVFIADDHPVLREGLTHVLQAQADIRVVGTASSGRDAVREVSHLHPNVVIADIAMPELNGIEATRQIGERCPKTRVVILAMHAGPDYIFHALEAGARGYLLKESAACEIIDAVRAVHAGKRHLCLKVADIVAEQVTRRVHPDQLDSLSRREREILQLLVEGHSSQSIAASLNLSPKTVATYRSRLMEKLQIHDVAGLVKFAIQHGLTTLE